MPRIKSLANYFLRQLIHKMLTILVLIVLFTSMKNVQGIEEKESALPSGTLCIYEGSSCDKRLKNKPGKLTSCNREIEDNTCMNFPSLGAIFTCAANEKISLFPNPGCASSLAKVVSCACVDMTLGTYFLLCCTSEANSSDKTDCQNFEPDAGTVD